MFHGMHVIFTVGRQRWINTVKTVKRNNAGDKTNRRSVEICDNTCSLYIFI